MLKYFQKKQNNKNELKKSLEEIRDLYDNAPCGYHSLDSDGVIIRINETELKWLGYQRDEIVGRMNFRELITEESAKLFHRTFPSFIRSGMVNDLEFEIIRKDGSTFFVEINATAVYDRNGKFVMSRSAVMDITRRKQAEKELNELNFRLEALVRDRTAELLKANVDLEEINTHLITEINLRKRQEKIIKENEVRWKLALEGNNAVLFEINFVSGKVFLSNRWSDLTGFNMEEAPDNIDALMKTCHPDDLIKVEHALQGYLDGSTGVYQVEHRILCRSGYVWIYCRGKVIRDETGKPFRLIGSEENIQERKLVEEALLRAKQEAESANKAKSNFLANMSHEIRTPMNGIIGMTELALMTELTEEQKGYLNIIKTSSSTLLRVLNDVLDYSKMEAGRIDLEISPFDIRKTVHQVAELFETAAVKKKLHIQILVDPDIPQTLTGDAIRLKQVLSNLVGNGIKFTNQGGIVIRVESVKGQNSAILRFVVSDTGIGVREDQLHKLFQRFSQVDESVSRQFGGTGLGLAISKKLVELMKGEIGVTSKEGVGSEFYFTAEFENPNGTVGGETSPGNLDQPFISSCLDKKRVLLVEDDEANRSVVTILLDKMGIGVTSAQNGMEAVKLCQKEDFDLILMDINMPVMDGFTATSAIRQMETEKGRKTPIIAQTAYALPEDRVKCLEAGMDDYISKPVDLQELKSMIERYL